MDTKTNDGPVHAAAKIHEDILGRSGMAELIEKEMYLEAHAATPADGGPAFPFENPNYDGNWDKYRSIGGMSLRDYFAASCVNDRMAAYQDPTRAAVAAYQVADAMLAERAKQK